MKHLLILVLALMSGSSMAGWEQVYQCPQSSYYVDYSSIRKTGTNVRMQYFAVFNKPNSTRSGKVYWSYKRLNEFDCREKRARALSVIWYAGQSAESGVVEEYHRTGSWYAIKVGNINEDLWAIACGYRTERP